MRQVNLDCRGDDFNLRHASAHIFPLSMNTKFPTPKQLTINATIAFQNIQVVYHVKTQFELDRLQQQARINGHSFTVGDVTLAETVDPNWRESAIWKRYLAEVQEADHHWFEP